MTDLHKYPPHEQWHDWTELDAEAWPDKVERNYTLVPTTCFNCEAGCGLVAYFDKKTGEISKIEGNPEHPGSRGRNCAKGPATLNQVYDKERILYPMKRVGERGAGQWERIGWEQALDEIGARIRTAIVEDRHNEIMYHVGRPGEDGYTDRVLKAWGVDGHNSHTNICSSNARIGYQSWMGHDRPSSDFANAKVIFLISAHLESGHYFNPHAQRIIEAQQNGAKIICVDPRLSNTGSKADYWLPTWPGTEAVPAAGDRPPPRRGRHVERGVHAAVDELGDVPAPDPAGPPRRVGVGAHRAPRRVRRVHPGVGGAEDRRRRGDDPRDRRADRRPPDEASPHTTGGRPAPATSAVGRSHAACSSSTCSPVRWRPRAARPATG